MLDADPKTDRKSIVLLLADLYDGFAFRFTARHFFERLVDIIQSKHLIYRCLNMPLGKYLGDTLQTRSVFMYKDEVVFLILLGCHCSKIILKRRMCEKEKARMVSMS